MVTVVKLLPQLVSNRFQILFHSPHRGSFHLSLTVLIAIGISLVFSLSAWSRIIQTGFLVSRPTQDSARVPPLLPVRACHPLRKTFPDPSGSMTAASRSPTTPALPQQHRFGLFPFRSPLLGKSIVSFFSCRYLDVSVPRVRFVNLCIQSTITIIGWVPPFRYPRINTYSQLPVAFRSVSRLSSPLIAKASTKCPYLSLDSYNINIKLALIFILLNKNLTFYPFSFTEKRFLVYISILLLPRFLLIIQYY